MHERCQSQMGCTQCLQANAAGINQTQAGINRAEPTSVSSGAPTSEKWSSSVSNSSACFPDAMAVDPGSKHCCTSGTSCSCMLTGDEVLTAVADACAGLLLVSGSSMLHQCTYVSAAITVTHQHQCFQHTQDSATKVWQLTWHLLPQMMAE